ncbi:hypothetical protein BX616_006500 [Lobosporangium transversale]|uniref:MD-2-related lipid-recognition domain-containing protein n=1 Tax=Lobosporangium transversale TaxID=64571 RepID=A0A1Y2H0V3_9FUNG|nr:hypothetical protein BCR41DRAFT_383396 [Lobosporangium transversale]KAF9915287.1 hypothetical protein BX616_006500 [Lobosporangium transversale]ORZ27631.1 hypothetical protein BCR41DRAFT_383396 [Lobosporangium transversale]|eukprot:XP_021885334.1 hypothetical protein BCR41DRAFT_383396 [Lobosporangium transversale]
MKFFSVAATLFIAAVANAQLQSLSLSSLRRQGRLRHPVTQGAKLNVVGKFLNRIVYTDAHDLCTLLAAQGHPCPVPVTLTSITACIKVKDSAPAGITVALQVSATNGNGHVLFCQAANAIAQKC